MFDFDILDKDANNQELRWCQVEVTKTITGTKKPTVEVLWNAIPELNIDIHNNTSIQILPERKWNKHIEGAPSTNKSWQDPVLLSTCSKSSPGWLLFIHSLNTSPRPLR